MNLEGPGCKDAQIISILEPSDAGAVYVKRSGFVPYAALYEVNPAAVGSCTVSVLLESGTELQKTYEAVDYGRGCCGGIYATCPANAPGCNWILDERGPDAGD